MKKGLIFLIFLMSGTLWLQGQSLKEVRVVYPTASESKEQAIAFAEMMSTAPTTDVVLQAYKGASKMILAKFTGKRAALLKEGKSLIEDALQQQPENAELHLIRLTVQQNLPKTVPYRSHITADKAFLKANKATQTTNLQAYISQFLEQ